VGEYKKKLVVLTDKYLLETFTKDQMPVQNPKDYEQLLRQQAVLLEQERDSRRKAEEQLRISLEESMRLRKEAQQLRLEKEKSM
jgi:hypothetical protein